MKNINYAFAFVVHMLGFNELNVEISNLFLFVLGTNYTCEIFRRKCKL